MSPLPPHHDKNITAFIISFLIYALLNGVIYLFGYVSELISSTNIILPLSKTKIHSTIQN